VIFWGDSLPDWELRRRRLTGHAAASGELVSEAQQSHSAFDVAKAAELPALRELLRISDAVMRANYFDEALEVIAEQALLALNASSVSISRWERQHNAVRTLINVGVLGEGEERWPENELYPVIDDGHVTELIRHGLPYTISIDDESVDPAEAAWLREIGKESELAVPVMYEDVIWGELWATGVDGRRFGADDVQLLHAIAAYAAVAIGRSELFSTVWRFAHQDPLTGLANRRELERCFEEMDWETESPALLVCDLDGFKAVNDRDGHPAGDVLLRHVASSLSEIASSTSGAIAVRLGGDEFCILLPRSTLAGTERFARDASRAVRRSIGANVTLSWGAAAFGPQAHSGQELIAAADAALLEAKRLGPGRFSVGVAGPHVVPGGTREREAVSEEARRATDRLLPRVVKLLDRHRPPDTVSALEILAVQVHNAVNAAAWSLSVTTEDGIGVRTIRGVHSVRDQISGLSVLGKVDTTAVYPLADYPATARVVASGEVFLAAVDLEDSDPTEIALLNRLGYRAVLAVGVADAGHRYLLEIYSAFGHVELAAIAPHLRVLARYCTTLND
jgi:diguanylate cyclase (GGDEF)-like protein